MMLVVNLVIILTFVGFSHQQETSLQTCNSEHERYDATQCIISYLNEQFAQFITLVSSASGANVNDGLSNILSAINGPTATKLDSIDTTQSDILSAINGPTATKLNSIDTTQSNILDVCNSAKQSCDAVRVTGVPAECTCSIGEGICPPTPPIDNGQNYHLAQDCDDLRYLGITTSGVYTIYPVTLDTGLNVYCDMETLNRAWIVIQRRFDGSVNFTQDWQAYRDGFGELNGEFWLGNKYIAALTERRLHTLRIDMGTFDFTSRQATYSNFRVENEEDHFRLRLGSYSGDAGDQLTYNNGAQFSTIDRDNDGADDINCAVQYKLAGWWYNFFSSTSYPCGFTTLNNPYSNVESVEAWHGISWGSGTVALKSTEMKIRSYT